MFLANYSFHIGCEFITVDESSKDDRTFRCRYGRGIKGQDIPHPDVFVCGERYTLIAAISMGGYLATRVIPGSCDSFQFFDFIVEDVVGHIVHIGWTNTLFYLPVTTDEPLS